MSIDYDVRQVAGEMLQMDPAILETRRYDTPFLRGWQLWMVDDCSDPPTYVYVATRDGAAIIPTFEEGFGPLVAVEPVNVANAEAAIDYTRLFFRATRPRVEILNSLEDIDALDDAVAAELTVEITPPKAVSTESGGWLVTAFLLDTGHLVRAEIDIAIDGLITPTLEAVAKNISYLGMLG